ncbi:hypothetical protein EDB85DRAFT_1892919 [Lactarius pseudohatsudake]|nr:hypothetical protein EDB85DRAFT_1892919 [Lactarius pseudohatsudake]
MACIVRHGAEFKRKWYLTLPSLPFLLATPDDDNDNEMGCDGGHSTPAPFPCAPPMTTVTGMAMALAAHTPDDDNIGDGITQIHLATPPATTMRALRTSTGSARTPNYGNDDDTGAATAAPPPAPAPRTYSDPAVAAPNHAAQRRQQRPFRTACAPRAGGSDGNSDAAAAAPNPTL